MTTTSTAESTPLISTRGKIELAIAAILLVAGALGARTWLDEHDARIKAEASIAAEQKRADAAEANQKQLADADKERDARTADLVSKMQQAAAQQITPAQIAAWLPKQANLPQPITVQIPPATSTNPAPAAVAEIPQADLPALRDQVTKCETCEAQLTTAQQDVASKDQQLKDASTTIAANKQTIGDLQTELKGGTFWKRFKKAAKVIGCAAGGAAIGALTKQPTAGAAIGAAAGGIGCSIF